MTVALVLLAVRRRPGPVRPVVAAAATTARRRPDDRAVARVQDQTIWASDVKREAVAQGLIGEDEPLDVTSDLFRRVLDEVIDQKLLAAEAERRGLDNAALAQRRLEATRERILGDMLVESVVDGAISRPGGRDPLPRAAASGPDDRRRSASA